MLQIKICGLTLLEDADFCVSSGANMLGFVFYKNSKRYISVDNVKKISNFIGDKAEKIGVFVNEKIEDILEIAFVCKLDYVQLHGDETVEDCNYLAKKIKVIKAFSISKQNDVLDVFNYINVLPLFDTYTKEYGGSGKTFNWNHLLPYRKKLGNFILSGGLNCKNIKEAVNFVKPYGVDVSSGVELVYGKKDIVLIEKFIKQARGCNG